MKNRMILQSRKELTLQIRERYNQAAWKEKIKIEVVPNVWTV